MILLNIFFLKTYFKNKSELNVSKFKLILLFVLIELAVENTLSEANKVGQIVVKA